ncbi:MAG TPA: zinc-ribbon domain-containing protein [Acidobacteriaceae bacterium]
MAGFCTKCGAPATGDTAFCTSCGAPLGAGGAAAVPAPTAYTPPVSNAPAAPPVYVPATATPARSGNSALKIILIIVGVFVGLGILSVCAIMFGIWRVSKAVKISNNGSGGVSVSTPGGSFSAGNVQVSASDLGTDIYPGATQQQGGVRVSTPNGTAITAAYVTSDSMDKVIDFYKGKLGSGASIYQSDKSAVLTLASEDKKDSVMVTISNEDADGKTKIGILHSKSS